MGEDEGRRFCSPVCFSGGDDERARDVADWRTAERARLKAERMALTVAARAEAGAALARHLDMAFEGRPVAGQVIGGYWPIKGEPDLRGWLDGMRARGAVIALPVIEERAAPLVFRLWEAGAVLDRVGFGIQEPPAHAPRVMPDVALAPLVGWDRAGYRLGYGAGYFDRTLAALDPRPLVIGVGFQSAWLPTIFPQDHDIAMDWIVTEAGVQRHREADEQLSGGGPSSRHR
jgi:5,10-methenyltetrahydrofolate synthetase